eukprot:10338736-Karenia_brevis.AAC.1
MVTPRSVEVHQQINIMMRTTMNAANVNAIISMMTRAVMKMDVQINKRIQINEIMQIKIDIKIVTKQVT